MSKVVQQILQLRSQPGLLPLPPLNGGQHPTKRTSNGAPVVNVHGSVAPDERGISDGGREGKCVAAVVTLTAVFVVVVAVAAASTVLLGSITLVHARVQ